MLSFIKENNGGQAEKDNSKLQNQNAVDDPKNPEQDYIMPAEHAKNAKKSTILLAVIFTVGALCLWFMIKKVTPVDAGAAISPEEMQIEAAIAQLTGVKNQMYTKMDKIIGKFDQFAEIEQIETNELRKNPFKHELFLGNLENLLVNKQTDSPAKRELIREEMRKRAQSLKLSSIINTSHGNCCIINETVFRKGGNVMGFDVGEITSSAVQLKSDGEIIILKIEE